MIYSKMTYKYDFALQESDTETEDFSSSTRLNEVNGQKKKRTRHIIIAVVLVIGLAVSIGVGLGIGLQKKKKESNDSEPLANPLHQNRSSTSRTDTSPTTPTITPTTPTTTPTSQQTTTETHMDWINEPCMSHNQQQCPWSNAPLLLVSLDGFRAEYLTRNLTPTLKKLSNCGVHTPYMRAVYPTLTFPNHYSIVTGLYPESHGIVDNNMYDEEINATFHLYGGDPKQKANPVWWGGEPIWITAKKQGKRSAAYFWVGSDVNISGYYPDIWKPYDGGVPFEERVDTVLEWLNLPSGERPDFIMLYFNEPDHTGHSTGPVSPEVDAMLGKVDKLISRLLNGLYKKKIHNCVNLIVLADHGMEKTSCSRKVNIQEYVDTKKLLVFDGTIGTIHKNFYEVNNVVKKNLSALSTNELMGKLQCKSSHLQMYTKADIPIRHHYTNSKRIGDVIIDVQAKWMVAKDKKTYCLEGNHGYDNLYKSMQALFLAHGPGFVQNFSVPPFENIELYNVMSDLLEIVPAPNNGTRGALGDILRNLPKIPNYLATEYTSCPVVSGATAQQNNSCSCHSISSPGYSTKTNYMEKLPFGEHVQTEDLKACVLHNTDYSTAYSQIYKMPVWTSYVLKDSQTLTTTDGCIITDERIPAQHRTPCTSFENDNITYTYLFDPGSQSTNTSSEAYLSSNVVPMYKKFKTGIWSYMQKILSDYAGQPGDLSFTVGPVFDYNHDGLWEGVIPETKFVRGNGDNIPIPTHFYIILMKCRDTSALASCSPLNLDIISFILPHLEDIPNCRPENEYLKQNVARIRDIELLTGLRFLTKIDASANLRTFLPTLLWPTSEIAYRWKDLPCEDSSKSTCTGKVPLLLISLDGFRADYLQRKLTPVIQKMRECGVHAPYMRSVYPTVTFPNHYTIVTGLYPESHGILSNRMYDPDIGEVFTLSSDTKMDPRWWGGEPIWITTKKQNKKSATFFWPGSDVNISGIYPDIWKAYDGSVGFPERVATVADWLSRPDNERPDFVSLYFDEPDHAGHQAGPDSVNVNDQLQTVDDMLSLLMDTLYQRDLHNCVNIIVVADHGFDHVSCSEIVKLPNYIKNIEDMLIFDGTFGRIQTKYHRIKKYNVAPNLSNITRPVKEVVNELTCKNRAMKVFTGETIPKRFHYYNNPRMGEILLDIKDQWLVTDTKSFYCHGGNHGWDNINKAMHALFLAHGPGFKKKLRLDAFENIELYNLMCELLGIEPSPNNGTIGSLHHILKNPTSIKLEEQRWNKTSCDTAVYNGKLVSACGCSNTTKKNMTDVFLGSSEVLGRQVGHPSLSSNRSLSILNYSSLVTGYDKSLASPAWTSFILTSAMISDKNQSEGDTCIVNDPRIQEISCDQYSNEAENVTVNILYDKDLVHPTSDKNIHFSSSAIPMYKGFKTGIWDWTWDLVRQYTEKYSRLSVTVGPVYDYNGDGLADSSFNNTNRSSVVVPTHLYLVLLKCKDPRQDFPCDDNIDILSFILPHIQTIPNCLDKVSYLQDNVARIRDVELLSGLQFFSFYNISKRARYVTFLPEQLWQAPLTNKWIDTECSSDNAVCDAGYQPLLLISLDGFRADYLLRNFTPYIKRLSQCGVHAPYMRSVYPTKTFPNHYSIVTGLYPESHGIIDNNMYDTEIRNKFGMSSSNASDPRWWGGEPIWNTARRQNKKSATYFWPGSDYEIGGMRPNDYRKYSGSVPFIERVDTVLSWMDRPSSTRPDFITLYFDEPDHAGHSYGPDDVTEIGKALDRVDEAVGYLMEQLYRRNLHQCVNIIIIADHGMSDTSCDRLISFRDYITDINNVFMYEGAFGRIDPYHKYSRYGLNLVQNPYPVSAILANLTCKSPHFKVFDKTLLPVRHHYVNNRRIEPIVVDVEDKWQVTFRSLKGYRERYCKGGNHGYDNLYKSMQALFLAHGPTFKHNLVVDAFENIELYNLMTDILNITAAPNNGTKGSLNHILKNPTTVSEDPGFNYSRNISKVTTSQFVAAVNNEKCRQQCPFILQQMYVIGGLLHLSSLIKDIDLSEHLPFGVPKVHVAETPHFLLYQPFYLTDYSDKESHPLWIAYSLSGAKVTTISHNSVSCVLPDIRVNTSFAGSAQCSIQQHIPNKYEWTSMLDQNPSTANQPQFSTLSSTYVPMLKDFKSGVWRALQKQTAQWAKTYGKIYIISGPVYDSDSDGHPDAFNTSSESVTIPSHFFMVLSRCEKSIKKCSNPTTLAFILPHVEKDTNCLMVEEYLRDNEARVRDVELITGLSFYSALPVDKAIHIRTYLPKGPWGFRT